MAIMTRRTYSLISIVCFILIAAALILIHSSPAHGYELSLYSSVSPLVWVFLILSVVGGLTIIANEAFAGDRQSHWWLAGLAVLILAYIVISIIPPLRGYVIYGRGDILTHAGWVKDMLSVGNIATYDYYPVLHTLIAQVSEIFGIDYITVMNYLPSLFALLHVISIYLLSKTVLSNRGQVLMATACGTLLVAWGNITLATRYGCFPTSLSTLIVPLVLFIYFKAKDTRLFQYQVMLIILLVLMPFFHPLCAAMLILFFIIIEISPVLFRSVIGVQRIGQNSFNTVRRRINLVPSFILFVMLFSWISGFIFFTNRLNNFYNFLLGEMGTGKGVVIAGWLSELNLGLGDTVLLFFKLYGDIFIYCILTAIAIMLIIKIYRISPDISLERMLALAACFVVSGFILVLLLLTNIIGPMRMLGFMSIFSIMLGGFILYELGKRKNFYKAIVISVLAVVAIIGIFHTYNSPYTLQPNDQFTQMDRQGYSWAFHYSDGNTVFTTFGVHSIHRFANVVLGNMETSDRGDITIRVDMPDHFNYGQYTTLGESFIKDTYFVITESNRLTFTQIWAEADRYSKSDFDELETDPTVTRLYTNGELEVYQVYATGD